MADQRQLHVFKDVGGINWVVAYDAADAVLAYVEHTGEEIADLEADEAVPDFVLCDDDEVLFINFDDEGEPSDDGQRKTMRVWADTEGRGFLCSTEC